jgi:hypothetical protein
LEQILVFFVGCRKSPLGGLRDEVDLKFQNAKLAFGRGLLLLSYVIRMAKDYKGESPFNHCHIYALGLRIPFLDCKRKFATVKETFDNVFSYLLCLRSM